MGCIRDIGKYAKNVFGVCKSIFTLNLKNGEGQKLRKNIEIHGELRFWLLSLSNKSESRHFYDFGPNGDHRESLKALRVESRMPAVFIFL